MSHESSASTHDAGALPTNLAGAEPHGTKRHHHPEEPRDAHEPLLKRDKTEPPSERDRLGEELEALAASHVDREDQHAVESQRSPLGEKISQPTDALDAVTLQPSSPSPSPLSDRPRQGQQTASVRHQQQCRSAMEPGPSVIARGRAEAPADRRTLALRPNSTPQSPGRKEDPETDDSRKGAPPRGSIGRPCCGCERQAKLDEQ